MLRPRTAAALQAAGEAGIHVVIATGRMYRSVRPYAEAVGITAPLVCYQGAAVVDPVTGAWLLHEPIPLELAREAIAAVEDEGFALNCYVDDDLYVAVLDEYLQQEQDDLVEVIDWIAAQPWCSGRSACSAIRGAGSRRCRRPPPSAGAAGGGQRRLYR